MTWRSPIYPSITTQTPPTRRGVLLLVVLSMLTLFLMLGTAYLVTASRARLAARAYSRLTFGGDDARVPHARVADMVLLKILRGGTTPPVGPAGTTVGFESLLADKYGDNTLSANVQVTTPIAGGTVPPVLTVSATLTSGSAHPTDLNGRLLTLAIAGRPASSHRILRARLQGGGSNTNTSGSEFTLSVDVPWRPGPWTGGISGRAVINGREFAGGPSANPLTNPANEGWDGFDDHNPFLARVSPGATIASSSVSRISYFPTLQGPGLTSALNGLTNLIPDGADNDNDGVPDGLFLDFGIPPTSDVYGNEVDIRASVLVVDLDGRFNVNAHDGLGRVVYTGTNFAPVAPAVIGSNTNWTTAVMTGSSPMGSGYGTCEIDGGKMFLNSPPNATLVQGNSFATSEHPTLLTLSGGPAARLCGDRSQSGRFGSSLTPQLGVLWGRYGWGNVVNSGWTVFARGTRISDANFRFALPGERHIDDRVSQINDRRANSMADDRTNYGVPPVWWTGASNYNWAVSGTLNGAIQPLPRGIYNSPPDLHGRMKTLTFSGTGIVPSLAFAQPEWSSSTDARESKDDPYELRLDTRIGFGGWLHAPMTSGTLPSTIASGTLQHNPFTAAELDPILRPYDVDANRLPPRLAAMLGSAAEESRLKVTTDSWDTTAITGSAAVALFGTGTSPGWLRGLSGDLYGVSPNGAVTGAVGGEVSRGEKFDLNRSLVASGPANAGYSPTSEYVVQRQAYFKDLYTLLVGLQPAADRAALAQWAANVVEFRDADSRVMPFEYDINPRNGWSVNGDVRDDEGPERSVVWGAERPEILIREVFAWRNSVSGSGGLAIALHRPWNAKAYATGSTNLIDAEPCDYALDTLAAGGSGSPRNEIDLGKKAHGGVLTPGTNALYNTVSGTTYPIWRLRLVAGGSSSYVRLDSSTAGVNEFVIAPAIANGSGKPKMLPDSNLSLVSGNVIDVSDGNTSGVATLAVTPPSVTIDGMRIAGTATSGTVYLERLSDPSGTATTAIWDQDPLAARDTTTVPLRYLVVDQMEISVTDASLPSTPATSRTRTATNPATAFWATHEPGSLGTLARSGTLTFPSAMTGTNAAWLPWPNRPFASAAELMLVPQGNAVEILQNYRRLTPSESGGVGLGRGAPVPLELLFDATRVPTRFAGIHTTTGTAAAGDLSAHGIYSGTSQSPAATVTANQLSSWREPGRVNLNTVVADDVWNAVVAGPLTSGTTRQGANLDTVPAETMAAVLALQGGNAGVPVTDPDAAVPGAGRNPLQQLYTATRLANTTTPRSNLFAVWITLRESVAGDPDSVRYRRAFYIVDRSIPVGFESGRDHNVWDCVRVRRIIE
jgi:hypothetical protein